MLFLICSLSVVSYATKAQAFIRIYNKHGKKIEKGTIELIADTVIVIENKKHQLQRVLVSEISFIRTRKSVWNSVAVGVGVGGLTSVWFADKAQAFGLGDNAAAIAILSGTAAGAIGGFIFGMTGDRGKFIINGDIERWKVVTLELHML